MLWVAGISLRITILAIPPVLPLVHRSLTLGEAAVGALTGLPIFLLAAGAIGGSLAIARIGARRAWMIGLLLVAVGSAARGAGPSAPMLYGMTFVMGLGIAICQPAAPTIIGEWFPGSIALATAVYVNGLLVGETLSAALTIPYLLPLLGGSWEWSLVVWSLPVWLALVLFALSVREEPPRRAGTLQWWPDWHDGLVWQLGLLFGGASVAYFGSNAFIPDYLHAAGRSELIAPSLTILNAGQLPGSFLTLFVAHRLAGRRDVFVALGAIVLASLVTFLFAPVWLALIAIGFTGAATSFTMVMTLALPPMVSAQHNIHRLTAGILTLSYGMTFAGSLAAGALWDATHVALAAFVPAFLGGIALLALGSRLRIRMTRGTAAQTMTRDLA